MKVFFFVFILVSIALNGQAVRNSTYARTIVDTLTSDYFAGRGHQKYGLDKAANFLSNEFSALGLDTWDGDYYQEFNYPVVIPRKAELGINGKEMRFGIDYLIPPNSPSFQLENAEILELSFRTFIQNNWRKPYESSAQLIVKIYPPDLSIIPTKEHKEFMDYYNSLIFLRNQNPRDVFIVSSSKLTYSIANEIEGKRIIQVKSEFFEQKTVSLFAIYSSYRSPRFSAKNVIGTLKGKTDSTIYITAHYDHLGAVGKSIFRGANDNASGVAMLLDLAKYFSKNPTKYTLVFIAFAGEEAGLIGSQYFTETTDLASQKIRFVLNFDIMGTGDEGVQIVNAKIFEKEYERLVALNEAKGYVKQIKPRGEACNSDHCPFYKAGIPAFFTYTLGGVSYYHDPLDSPETLPLTKFAEIKELFIAFINEGL